jgi:hypothetical protein
LVLLTSLLMSIVGGVVFATNAKADPTTGRISILSEPAHQQFTDWGYDIKQPNKAGVLAYDANLATRLFGDADDSYDLDVLRIPIYTHAHRLDGSDVVCGSFVNGGDVKPEACSSRTGRVPPGSWDYRKVFDAVTAARTVKQSVKIFASLRLIGGSPDSYPAWVKNEDGTVDGPKYASLLCRYLQFSKSRGVTIDVLGPDNEGNDTRGDISPGKHKEIVGWLSANCSVPLPMIIGPERMSPAGRGPNSLTAGEWLYELFTQGLWDAIDFAGVHYYSARRTWPGYAAKLATFAGYSNPTGLADDSRTLWNSEFHWQECKPARDSHCAHHPAGSNPNTTYWDAKLGLMAAFDNFDNGFQGMVWWNFLPWTEPKTAKAWTEVELRSQMESELVRSATDAYPLDVDDQDDRPMDRRRFNTRAFKNGSDILLWVINDTNAHAAGKWIEVPGKDVDNDSTSNGKAVISYTRWTNTSRTNGTANVDETRADGPESNVSIFTMGFPKKSVTVVRIPDVYPPSGE